ncbi:MAG: DUF4886 domain-containing protein [Terriglobales bacterium]
MVIDKLQRAKRAICSLLVASFFMLRTGLAAPAATVHTFFDSESNATDATRILFIGNSFTYANQLPLVLGTMVFTHNMDAKLKITEVSGGGMTLEQHWREGDAARAISANPPWTYVVLQEQSLRPIVNSDKMFQYVQGFAGLIRGARSRTVLFLTWADSQKPDDQDHLTQSYRQAASQTGAILVPVGEAFRAARNEIPGIQLFSDGHHPSQTGTYLAACVFYAKLFGLNPEALPAKLAVNDEDSNKAYLLASIDANQAKLLQRIAWRVARQY